MNLLRSTVFKDGLKKGLSGLNNRSLLDLDIIDHVLAKVDAKTVNSPEWISMDQDGRRGYRYVLITEATENASSAVNTGDLPAIISLPEPVEKNINNFAKVFSLSQAEKDIFKVFFAGNISADVNRFLRFVSEGELVSQYELIAAIAGRTGLETRKALGPNSPLIRFEWITGNMDISFNWLKISPQLIDAFLDEEFSTGGFQERFAPLAPAPSITLEDYEHIKQDVDFALRLVRGSVKSNTCGVNILLHGLPGTGKSELARILAKEAGVNLRQVGMTNGDSDENPTARGRLRSLLWSTRLIKRSRDSILVVEEADELFSLEERNSEPAPSKFHLNWVLETNPVPTIFNANSISLIDPAILSRMSYIIEFKTPGENWRAKTWERHCPDYGTGFFDSQTINMLAKKYPVTPRLVAKSIETASLAASGNETLRIDDIERVVTSTAKLQGIRPEPGSRKNEFPYSLAHVNADRDLNHLTRQIGAWDRTRGGISLCLYGASGTGKSAYCKHLAERLGLEILLKRGSDIISPFVGMTEQKIADAFKEARDGNVMLIWDEVDSFLSDRRSALRQHEVSWVNEFLTQLEAFDGVVAATTNLMDNIDQAGLRRFLLKARFDWLKPEQSVELFKVTYEHLAGTSMANLPKKIEHQLRRLGNIAPSDFANISRRLRLLSVDISPSEILRELEQELSLKEGGSQEPIGFCA